MNQKFEKDGFLHTLNNVLSALAVLYLAWSLIDWLFSKGRFGSWLGTCFLIFIPVWLCCAFVVGSFRQLVLQIAPVSDGAFYGVNIAAVTMTAIVTGWLQAKAGKQDTIEDSQGQMNDQLRQDELGTSQK